MIPDSLIDEVKKLMNYTADQPAKVCEFFYFVYK